MAGLLTRPSDISKIGIKREATFGTEEAGPYRGLLATNFEVTPVTEAGMLKKVSGAKGAHSSEDGPLHYEISFTICASSSDKVATNDSDMATLIDVMNMLFDTDTVSGVGPFTHTFTIQSIVKPSWTLYHETGMTISGNPRNYTYEGFVLSTVSITIDKASGFITVEVTVLAQDRNTVITNRTTNFTTGVRIWNPENTKFEVGSVQYDNWNVITINFDCETEAIHTINASKTASQIDGMSMNCSVELEGFYDSNTTSEISTTFEDNFKIGGVSLSDIDITMASAIGILTNDTFVLNMPKTRIEVEESKTVSPGEMLPQNVTLFAIHDSDLAANGFNVVMLNDVDEDWDTK